MRMVRLTMRKFLVQWVEFYMFFKNHMIRMRKEGVERCMQHTIIEQITNLERGRTAPHCEIPRAAEAAIQNMKENMRFGTPAIFLVVRCWNKDRNAMEQFLQKVKRMKEHMPKLAGVFLSINKNTEGGDINNQTEVAALDVTKNLTDVPIVPLGIIGYTWTAGLNAPAAVAHMFAQEVQVDESNIVLLNQSFDIEMDDENLQKMSQRLAAGQLAPTVRIEKGRLELKHLSQALGSLQELLLNQVPSEEVLSYIRRHPEMLRLLRNTNAAHRLDDLVALGGFNPVTNSYGGMEDHEFLIRFLLYLKQTDRARLRMVLDTLFSEDAYVTYQDLAWDGLLFGKKLKKLMREKNANSLIATLIASLKESSTYAVPLSERDFAFRSS